MKEGYAPMGYHLEKDKIDSSWNHIKKLVNSTIPEVTIKKSEYENLKKRANMSLWEKFKETLGF